MEDLVCLESEFPWGQSPTRSPDHVLEPESDSGSDEGEIRESSPADLPTPVSVTIGSHPPSPLEDYTSYTQLIKRIADVLDLAVVQPQLEQPDQGPPSTC